eukprot:2128031-Rhodomonas_salina.2
MPGTCILSSAISLRDAWSPTVGCSLLIRAVRDSWYRTYAIAGWYQPVRDVLYWDGVGWDQPIRDVRVLSQRLVVAGIEAMAKGYLFIRKRRGGKEKEREGGSDGERGVEGEEGSEGGVEAVAFEYW